jgi:hypothetical protein
MRAVIVAIFLLSTSAFAEQSCPGSFGDFLQQVEGSREFQQNNITYPLQYSFVDSEAEPEPATVNQRLSSPEVTSLKEPIYPSPQVQQSVPLMREINDQSHTRKAVRLYKPDTGYLLEYHFELINGCWKLTKFEDLSI